MVALQSYLINIFFAPASTRKEIGIFSLDKLPGMRLELATSSSCSAHFKAASPLVIEAKVDTHERSSLSVRVKCLLMVTS